MERRMAILKQVEPILESAIKILTQVIDVKGMMGLPAAKPATPPPPPPVVSAPAETQPDLSSQLAQLLGGAQQ